MGTWLCQSLPTCRQCSASPSCVHCRQIPAVREPSIHPRALRTRTDRIQKAVPVAERIRMSPENKDQAIKITLDDLASVTLPNTAPQVPAAEAAGGARVYGSV